MLRLALPSNSELQEPTLHFFESCGLAVDRPSQRRYTATIPTLPEVAVLFQRSADIPAKVEEGTADLGIVGLERFLEDCPEGSQAFVVLELGYGRCELVLAVPDIWIDVTSVADLADLSVTLRERGQQLRVATKYPRLTEQFFRSQGVRYFTLVEATGSLEAAPIMGYADIIADITSTGVTLRENRLKTLSDGTLIQAQACLVGNRRLLAEDASKLETTRLILERMEARLRATGYYSITANLRGPGPEAIAEHLRQRPEVAGLEGPTIAKVYSKDREEEWYAVTIVVAQPKLMSAVEHLRRLGGRGITVTSTNYVFEEESQAYLRLLRELKGGS